MIWSGIYSAAAEARLRRSVQRRAAMAREQARLAAEAAIQPPARQDAPYQEASQTPASPADNQAAARAASGIRRL